MLAIIDYGVGNLFSLSSSLAAVGTETVVTSDPRVLRKADQIILPGVGAFGDAAAKLAQNGLDEVVKEEALSGKPLMGICLGMQLLFDEGHEYGIHKGLGLIKGTVLPMAGYVPSELKIPQIGWNRLDFNKKDCPLFKYISDGSFVYFVHSYYAKCDDKNVLAYTDYGAPVTAAAGNENIFGCQFHPEKSGKTGLEILRAFSEL